MHQELASSSLVEDQSYAALTEALRAAFARNVAGHTALFTTSATGLFDAYLAGLPESHRQEHTCNTCRRFVDTFGGLVTIDENGDITPIMWAADAVPDSYRHSVAEIERRIRSATVTGVFLSSDAVWGTPEAGGFHHFHVTPPNSLVYRRSIKTAGQASAEKREDYRILSSAMSDYGVDVVAQAVTLLRSDALYRSEKVLGVGAWLEDLHRRRDEVRGRARANIVWRAVALAPAGFCHPRSSMIGTLLQDIADGLSFDAVKGRFDSKMHPLQYQRPQAAPSAGNIAQAEKIVEQLGIANSLRRRFARVDEVVALWGPTERKAEAKPAGAGVFAHLAPKGSAPTRAPLDIPATTMTWDKFARTVLLSAEEIEVQAPNTGNYVALVTAVDPDAPPILQWDLAEQRNPVSWYLYSGGSRAERWGMVGGVYHRVTAITHKPPMWGDAERKFAHHGEGAVFILEGAVDSGEAHLCLFPETLKSELREIRTTIEAFSAAGTMEGRDEASACGLLIGTQGGYPLIARATVNGVKSLYRIDRWD